MPFIILFIAPARKHHIKTVGYPFEPRWKHYWGFPDSSMVKNPPSKAGDIRDMGSIPGLGRSPREGNGNPPQYSY